MTRLMLNDGEQSLDTVPDRWSDLLEGLDQRADAHGEVVTAVRFDGVDEPAYREPAQMDRIVRDIDLIEVQTATPYSLLDDALAEGAAAAGALATAAGGIGSSFRGPNITEANQRLAELGEGTRSMISILGAVASARGIGLDQLEWDGHPLTAQLTALAGQLESIVAAQQSRDWLTVADLLEYEFQPALQAWQPVFDGLRSRMSKE
jgi:hypothetical protein